MEEKEVIAALQRWGYLDSSAATTKDSVEEAVEVFKTQYGESYDVECRKRLGRPASYNGDMDQVVMAMVEERTCDVPDFVWVDGERRIEEARWPEECALTLEASFQDPLVGLSRLETMFSWAFSLAQWNTVFDSPMTGKIYSELIVEFRRLLGDIQSPERLYVLPVGTITHEDGHALGLPHTPGDRDSVMYPSMRGQWLLNKTDRDNLKARRYSAGSRIKLALVDWRGENATHIWAKNRRLPGSVLAWSHLAQGNCRQRAEQAYDSTIRWNSGGFINLPAAPPPPIPPPSPQPPAPEFEMRVGSLVGRSEDGSQIQLLPDGNRIRIVTLKGGT